MLQLWLLQAPWAIQANLLLCGAGGMSMQPVTIPTGLQIFKGIKAMGFWLSKSVLPCSCLFAACCLLTAPSELVRKPIQRRCILAVPTPSRSSPHSSHGKLRQAAAHCSQS